jgi:5-methylcytosine-specific restriction endonuclease McrA
MTPAVRLYIGGSGGRRDQPDDLTCDIREGGEPVDEPTKRCTRCGEHKPLGAFGRKASHKDGLSSRCKACMVEVDRSGTAPPRPRPTEQGDGLWCTRCRAWKEPDDFARDRTRKSGRRGHCRACEKENREANREKHRERHRSYYQRNRERILEYFHQLYRTHGQKIRDKTNRWHAQHAERMNKASRIWRKNNPERIRTYVRARRARKRGAPGSHTPAEWVALCIRYGNRCLSCGKPWPLSADHIVPLSRGGSNDIANLQPLCLSCNDRKGTKVIDYHPRETKRPRQLALFGEDTR